MISHEQKNKINIEEICVLKEVIDVCRDVLRESTLLEQLQDARDELQDAINRYRELIEKLYH